MSRSDLPPPPDQCPVLAPYKARRDAYPATAIGADPAIEHALSPIIRCLRAADHTGVLEYVSDWRVQKEMPERLFMSPIRTLWRQTCKAQRRPFAAAQMMASYDYSARGRYVRLVHLSISRRHGNKLDQVIAPLLMGCVKMEGRWARRPENQDRPIHRHDTSNHYFTFDGEAALSVYTNWIEGLTNRTLGGWESLQPGALKRMPGQPPVLKRTTAETLKLAA